MLIAAYVLYFKQIFPGLRSFCVASSIAMAVVYLLQITWFVAWATLDEKRIREKRDGILPCLTLETWERERDERGWLKIAFGKVAVIQKTLVFKV